jgi:hypothetical protein
LKQDWTWRNCGMKMTAFWDIVLCSLVEVERRFRGVLAASPWWWRQEERLKHWPISTKLHGAVSHTRRHENLKSQKLRWLRPRELLISALFGIR